MNGSLPFAPRVVALVSVGLAATIAGCGPSLLEPPPDEGTGTAASTEASADSDGEDTSPPVTTTPPDPSTSTSTTAADSSSGDPDDGSFIEDPDCGLAPDGTSFHCTSFECDPIAQDCPRGEKCMPWANDGGTEWNSNRCAPIFEDAAGIGEVCMVEGSATSGVDYCQDGSMCWAVDPETNLGVCKAFCDPDDDVCAEPQHCVLMADDSLAVCVTACNPIDPAGCPEGEACRWVNVEELVCLPEQGGNVEGSGQLCGEDDIECSPDHACITDTFLGMCESYECCTPWCDTTDPRADAMCAALHPAQVCLAWYLEGQAPPGLETLGACAVPPP